MTLGEFAVLLDADPKWVQNVAAALAGRLSFTIAHARRLTVARVLTESAGMSLTRAWDMAAKLLEEFKGDRFPVTIQLPDPDLRLTIDLYRILARLSARQAWLKTQFQPRRRGRPGRRRSPLRVAREYGLDLSLLQYNLGRTPLERLRMLDAMAAFRHRGRRV